MRRVVQIWPSTETGEPRRRPRWSAVIILLAICSLTASLATRSFHHTFRHRTNVVSASSQGMRQHLDRDAVKWTRPAPVLAVFDAPAFYPRVAPAGPPLPSLLFEQSLYNRPPPTC